MSPFTFTAPRAGWYRFVSGAEPEYLDDGPKPEVGNSREFVTLLFEGQPIGFESSNALQIMPNNEDLITIQWDHE